MKARKIERAKGKIQGQGRGEEKMRYLVVLKKSGFLAEHKLLRSAEVLAERHSHYIILIDRDILRTRNPQAEWQIEACGFKSFHPVLCSQCGEWFFHQHEWPLSVEDQVSCIREVHHCGQC